MQYHAIPCNTMQYYAIQCNTMQYHAIPCNIMQYHAIPCNTMQYHAIPCNTMQYHAIPCNTMQYYAIQCNTMQYHASLTTADGAYHCPVSSIRAIFNGIVPQKHFHSTISEGKKVTATQPTQASPRALSGREAPQEWKMHRTFKVMRNPA